jgi:PIN domain nuclease of toxin-antitoxin system
MRFLLDTNILAFFILGETENLSSETVDILNDYNSQLYTSSINVLELLQLYNIGKIKSKKHKSANDLFQSIEKEYIITILPFTKQHTETL